MRGSSIDIFEFDILKKLCRRYDSLNHDNTVCQEIIIHHMCPIVEYPPSVNQQGAKDPNSENEEMKEPQDNHIFMNPEHDEGDNMINPYNERVAD